MKTTLTKLAAVVLCMTTAVALGSSYLRAGTETTDRVIKITAHKFAYEPDRIELKRGEPVVLELTSKDVTHGFNISDLGLRADLDPGETVRLRIVPEKTGTFEFHCDNFCGVDHESMSATITVTE
ncbi:MAG TPA: cupredoxin domain-containing protein [Candidatus Binatia bacterium]|jgi:cytochrome c oxidase subunit 2